MAVPLFHALLEARHLSRLWLRRGLGDSTCCCCRLDHRVPGPGALVTITASATGLADSLANRQVAAGLPGYFGPRAMLRAGGFRELSGRELPGRQSRRLQVANSSPLLTRSMPS